MEIFQVTRVLTIIEGWGLILSLMRNNMKKRRRIVLDAAPFFVQFYLELLLE